MAPRKMVGRKGKQCVHDIWIRRCNAQESEIVLTTGFERTRALGPNHRVRDSLWQLLCPNSQVRRALDEQVVGYGR